MSIVIVKTISLDFLGDRYKGSYIEERSISMREREALIKDLDKIKDETKSFEFVKATVEERFVKGELKDGDTSTPINKEDLLDFPSEVYLEILSQLQGRIDPKA